MVETKKIVKGFSSKVVKTKSYAPHKMIVPSVSKGFYLKGGHYIRIEMNRTDLTSIKAY